MSDRREFLRQAAALTVGLAASDTGAVSAQQRADEMPTPRASALMAAFGLRYPIFSAGMGTVATPELAIAVSNAGGLGVSLSRDCGRNASIPGERRAINAVFLDSDRCSHSIKSSHGVVHSMNTNACSR